MAEKFVPLIPEEEGNESSWYKASAAGIASGIIKVPEGIFSLAAELIDLGLDTNSAADVEMFFDKLNPFEEEAEKHGAGKLTQALVSIGIPSTYGFKLGSKLARKALENRIKNTSVKLGGKNLTKTATIADRLNKHAGAARFAAGVAGGAAGETFVADVEEIGSFGDVFDTGPTQLDRWDTEGREDATRKLLNRLKFGAEGLLLTPFVAGVGKGAMALATKGRDLAYSNSRFERWVDKIGEMFRPEGKLSKELFVSQKVMEGFKASDANLATEIVRDLTRAVDQAFPAMQRALEKSTPIEKKDFYKELNALVFDGNIAKPLDDKVLAPFLKRLEKANVGKETAQDIVSGINRARDEFRRLTNLTQGKGAPELKEILKERINGFVGNTYKIFESKPILGIFNRYRPTDEVKVNAINFFRRMIAKKDTARKGAYDPNGNQYYQEAREMVDDIIDQSSKAKNPAGLPDLTYINKTMEGKPGAEFLKRYMEKTGQPIHVIRKLLGEVTDPRFSIFNTITNLSSMARMNKMLEEISETNLQIQKEGGKGAFWATPEKAREATNGVVDIIDATPLMGKLTKFGDTSLVNPLAETPFTTKAFAEGISTANYISDTWLTGFVRGRGDASATEKGASWLYRNLLLFPKGLSQLAKTVLSIPTHIRNFMSAGAFAGANGILFTNPKLLAKSFKDGLKISGMISPTGIRPKEMEKLYREFLELGIVNSQVQIGDMKNLFRDLKWGDQAGNLDSVLSPMMNKLKKIPQWLQGKYVAEDDTWKITNYLVEMSRRNAAYKRAGITKTTQQLKQESADIVKNTVPNYAYVGDVVRTARLLPVGNFMSFPSEMIRTTTNIAQQAVKEMKHLPGPGEIIRGSDITPMVYIQGKGLVGNNNPMYRIGATRAVGMATTLTVVPTAVVEGAKALYDVTEDEIAALRQFVPEWSKNSTLVPVRDDDTGELKYIDFSHSNAYDLIARPFRTMANEITAGTKDGDTILEGFLTGVDEASTELASPFIDESIWTEAAGDLIWRKGTTKDGRQLYTDQTSWGDKKAIQFRHLMEALAPSYKQGLRLYQTATDTPTKSGQYLEGKTLGVNDQVAGFMGLRPIKVDPLRAMGFKIAEYQRGIRNARREFTGGYFGLLKGGPINPNDVIKRFVSSNAARFNVQREMFKNINAAQILGESKIGLMKEFEDRQLTSRTFFDLSKGKFQPYFPSADIEERFREIARDLGDINVFNEVRPVLREIAADLRQLSLEDEFDIKVEDYITPEIQTPPLPLSVTSAMPNSSVITQGQNILNQGQANASGLTQLEEHLLSDEEKLIRQRSRGITA